jgi:DNA-binding transcriptional MocR family regulator
MSNTTIPTAGAPKDCINLLRGWPSPSLLPTASLAHAANSVFADPALSTPCLDYGPDAGFQPLRVSLAQWLTSQYVPRGPDGQVVDPDADRICITSGASQGLACILASFTDPAYTKGVWLAAPCYYLACPVFDDAGLSARLNAVKENADGIDMNGLEERMIRSEGQSDDLVGSAIAASHP